MSKAMKGIYIIKKIKTLPQHSLVTIYKQLVRLHLDYVYIIYDQPSKKIEGFQYNSVPAITDVIKGIS